MLEQLIDKGEKIYKELCQMKKGDKLERTTWLATCFRYIEYYGEDSKVNEVVFEIDLFDEPLTIDHVIFILATLKSDLSMKELKQTKSTVNQTTE